MSRAKGWARPLALLAVSVVLVLAHLLARGLGLAEHTSAIAGMPIAPASWILGPLHLLVALAAVVVAPVFAIAAGLDAAVAVALRRRAPHARGGSPATRGRP